MPAASTIVRPGFRSGRLTVRELFSVGSKGRERRWLCDCDCGGTARVTTHLLLHQQTQSCGCLTRERMSRLNLKHGHTRRSGNSQASPTYRSWMSMMHRCYRPTTHGYERYGGRGITVCDRWQGDGGFERFLADMGTRPSPDHSLDRIDTNGNYEPSNCRWATRTEQSRNKRTSRLITANGEMLTPKEWSLRLGGQRNLVGSRLADGWGELEAVTTPHRLAGKEPR